MAIIATLLLCVLVMSLFILLVIYGGAKYG